MCFISEPCTPGITLNTMANDLQFAGIDPGRILKGQIKDLGDLIEMGLSDPCYMDVMGDFRDRFRLIRYGKFYTMIKGEKQKNIFNVAIFTYFT